MTEASAGNSRTRILIVDDNRQGLIARQHVLRESGHDVSISETAREALDRFQRETFDLVITDFKMPASSGVELIQDLRKLKPEVPIILISGFSDALGLDEETTGADAVIQKSHTEVQQLLRAVSRLLRKAQKKPPRSQPPSTPLPSRKKG